MCQPTLGISPANTVWPNADVRSSGEAIDKIVTIIDPLSTRLYTTAFAINFLGLISVLLPFFFFFRLNSVARNIMYTPNNSTKYKITLNDSPNPILIPWRFSLLGNIVKNATAVKCDIASTTIFFFPSNTANTKTIANTNATTAVSHVSTPRKAPACARLAKSMCWSYD